MNKLSIRSAFAVLLTALSVSVVADAKFVRKGESNVTFRATGPAGMKFDGRTHELSVSEDGGSVVVAVPLSGLSTGIALRDKHMKEKYLEVPKYPKAELRVARSSLKIPADGAETTGDSSGRVDLHGKNKVLPFHYVAKREGDLVKVVGSLRLNMKEFDVEVPSYLGVTVKPEVDITVRFETKDE